MKNPILSIERYRIIAKDQITSDAKIVERINYLEVLCRNVIREEIEKYKKQKITEPY